MRYRTPERREASVRAVLEALEDARRVVLTTHLNADGDGVGCEAALLDLLDAKGIEARIVNPTPFPSVFRFLLGDPDPVLAAGGEPAAEWCREADLCMVLDTGEKNRLGRVKPMVDALPKIVLDHHPPGSDAIEGVRFLDDSAAAAGELVLDLALAMDGPWTPRVVEGIYVAILTDTGSFRFSNATPRAHFAAGDLIALGVRPDVIHRRVYENVPARRIELLRRSLPTLDRTEDGRVAWITVPHDAYRELGCDPADLDGLADYPRSLEGVEVALVFRRVEDGVKISFRSTGATDVNEVARHFGGGGHLRASGALVKGSLEEVRDRVIEAVRAAVAGTGKGAAAAGAATGSAPER